MENYNLIINKLEANIIEEVHKQLRTSRLTQKELATKTGINASTLSKLLLGKSNFSIEQLAKIALALGKDISDFLSFRNIGIENTSNIYSTTDMQESDNFVFDTTLNATTNKDTPPYVRSAPDNTTASIDLSFPSF